MAPEACLAWNHLGTTLWYGVLARSIARRVEGGQGAWCHCGEREDLKHKGVLPGEGMLYKDVRKKGWERKILVLYTQFCLISFCSVVDKGKRGTCIEIYMINIIVGNWWWVAASLSHVESWERGVWLQLSDYFPSTGLAKAIHANSSVPLNYESQTNPG